MDGGERGGAAVPERRRDHGEGADEQGDQRARAGAGRRRRVAVRRLLAARRADVVGGRRAAARPRRHGQRARPAGAAAGTCRHVPRQRRRPARLRRRRRRRRSTYVITLSLSLSLFSARCNIYISRLCYDVSVRLSVRTSVCLSVMEVHWRIIANWAHSVGP